MNDLINLEEILNKQDSPKRFIDYIKDDVSHMKTIHSLLRDGYYITKQQIIRRLGCLNLGGNIHKLRKKYGYNYIITKMEVGKKSGRRYAVYHLNEKYIDI